ncbi:NADPH oxidase activator 1 [Gadus morhua]|uniref:NADPH oxidase activator 1 n=1 Tax=Gadus morhua TaxID=8049 RepID=UPI0011B40073|nr:NADPH oxidase activator 1-like [Gadus morhua]XP_030213988.1 NADPH oxidase activator 1-like [Gadus morhua]
MLYTELLRLWDEAVRAMDARDWRRALELAGTVAEPNSRTLFIEASAHLALQELEPALQALNQVILKDGRLAVAFFQRSAVLLQLDRLDDALSDCIWAKKHMRDNTVIDYRQLGLPHKLFSWQVVYNSAAVYSRMGQWEQARELLLSASQEKGAMRSSSIAPGLESISRGEVLNPILVPDGVVFRPRKQEVEQLQQKDFLGKAKVITSMIPNDDFGGFEPLRMQKPGYYEPKKEGADETRYMRIRAPYMARGRGQLTIPGGATVFLYDEVDKDGMATVIYDGQRGLLPMTLLDPIDLKKAKGKRGDKIPSGIPLPPGVQPPTRPRSQPSTAAPAPETPPPSYSNATLRNQASEDPPVFLPNSDSIDQEDVPDGEEQVVVKVHFTYTLALSINPYASYKELQDRIARKLGQPPTNLRLRHRASGSQLLTPLEPGSGSGEESYPLLPVVEEGRATLWCQLEDPLAGRAILYHMVALYDYTGKGPEDLEFSEGETIDILGEVNEEWLEGHCAGNIGIFPRCFVYSESAVTEKSIL